MAKGKKTGGRQKGAKNRSTLEREGLAAQRIIAARNAGLTPLEFMLNILRDPEQPLDQRYAAARDAAPYMHPRLASSTVKLHDKRSVADLDTAELVAQLQQESHINGAAEAQDSDGTADPLH